MIPGVAAGLLAKPWKWFRPQKQKICYFYPKTYQWDKKVSHMKIGDRFIYWWAPKNIPVGAKSARAIGVRKYDCVVIEINRAQGYIVLEY